MLLPQRFLRGCRRKRSQVMLADSTGQELSGGSVLLRTLILRRLLAREVLADDEKHVGILLPPSVGGVLTNAAVTLLGRVAANLNYTVTSETLNDCIRQAGIRHVLTSRKVTDRFSFDLEAEIVHLEDLRDKVTTADKAIAAMGAYATPLRLLDRMLGIDRAQPDDVMTVIFTSGSTGQPKGVMLTQRNILSNVEAMGQVVQLHAGDTIVGILPFFHSFGYTISLWGMLGLDIRGVYHYTPLDARNVAKLCRKYRATVLLATPTFLRSYLRRAEREDFESLEIVVVGAEKMPIDLAEQFESKFGVRPIEGYGTTELSPLVSVNVPPARSASGENDLREGSVGRPVPGVTAKVVDPESGEDLPVDTPGMLLIKGANVMQGYLNQPEKTAEVVKEGWYVTGDIARIDPEGFIHITGRLSRFSKLGGEMVPHVRIEEELAKIYTVEGDEEDDKLRVAVTSVTDEKKGERLIVLHLPTEKTPEEIRRKLSEAGFPNLWLPSTDSFFEVDAIPVLGSGKLDLQQLRQVAEEKTGLAKSEA